MRRRVPRIFLPAIDAHRRNVEKFDFNLRRSEQGTCERVNLRTYLVGDETSPGSERRENRIENSRARGAAHGRERYPGDNDIRSGQPMQSNSIVQFQRIAAVHDEPIGFHTLKQRAKSVIDLDSHQRRVRPHRAQDRPRDAARSGAQLDYHMSGAHGRHFYHPSFQKARAWNDGPDLLRMPQKLPQECDSVIVLLAQR